MHMYQDKETLFEFLVSKFPVGNLDTFRYRFEEWWENEASRVEENLLLESKDDDACPQAEQSSSTPTPQTTRETVSGHGDGPEGSILDPEDRVSQ